MLARFTPDARRTVVRAGMLATDAGRNVLGTDYLLMALTESPSLGGLLAELGVTGDALRVQVEGGREVGLRDRELLASLGIDLDEIHRRTLLATSLRPDDPALWRLHRSRTRPLRITLTGPATEIVLDGSSRKAIEVAQWASRRGRRTQVSGEDLLWGLLADASNDSVVILRRSNVDLRRLWGNLRRWHQAA
ncbi:Clp protease N-terminal domain-containing protein [Actinomadura spongiicola]|nr:Clp protease N-terminal domain-containing protein [Actinomadura spongiicola]